MKKILKNKFFATGIGSVPYKDSTEAIGVILKNFPSVPFWPQLPKRTFFENMYAQFIEGFPGEVVDTGKQSLWIDTSKEFISKVESSYQKVIDEDLEYFSITEKRASGFFEFLKRIKQNPPGGLKFVKGHITGPISFGLSVTDENKKAILYNSELSELLGKILSLKTKWQIKKIKEVFGNIIIFIDEPYLVSIGSSVVNIKRSDVVHKLNEIISAIHNEGALAGVHCCGNTDWSILLGTGIDILNFDAYNYMKSISLYPQELSEFLDRDGLIAWGIVPTSEEIANENAESLVKRLEAGTELLAAKSISKDKLLQSSMITPSCGCGTMEVKDAERVLELTRETSELLRKKYA